MLCRRKREKDKRETEKEKLGNERGGSAEFLCVSLSFSHSSFYCCYLEERERIIRERQRKRNKGNDKQRKRKRKQKETERERKKGKAKKKENIHSPKISL